MDAVSVLLVPMIFGTRPIGAIAFHSVNREHAWEQDDVKLLRLLGEIVANALARQSGARALQRAKDAAESANRAKSDFLASMIHELRTPLNGILGYAQLLRRDDSLGPAQLESVEAIERCGEHLLTVINEVLDLAKIEACRLDVEITRFRLDAFLRGVADVARIRTAQAGLSFAYETQGRLPAFIESDQRKLRQVLINLLGNAIKFTDTGGVHFRIGRAPGAPGRTRLRFEVEDTGISIAAENLEKIFEPFHQVRHAQRHVEGTGLGLAICRKLVASLGGTLNVRSEPGRGSLHGRGPRDGDRGVRGNPSRHGRARRGLSGPQAFHPDRGRQGREPTHPRQLPAFARLRSTRGGRRAAGTRGGRARPAGPRLHGSGDAGDRWIRGHAATAFRARPGRRAHRGIVRERLRYHALRERAGRRRRVPAETGQARRRDRDHGAAAEPGVDVQR
jgi:signal transduction histidine kinase